ncbi:MAG: 23S rRNA (uracil(1939)-C(5))-methyltransferase RlmD [Acholeplasmataceae bacterium]
MKVTCEKMMNLDTCQTNLKTEVKYMLEGESIITTDQNLIIHEKEIINPSPDRIKIKCPIFDRCGGCDFLHINYQKQLKMKEEYVKELYDNAGFTTVHLPIISNDEPLYYRHKVVLSATTKKGKLRLGLYREYSKEIIPFIDCYIHEKSTHDMMHTLEELFHKYKIPAYDYKTNTGMIKHIMMRISQKTKDVLVVIVTNGHLLPNGKKIVSELVQKHPKVQTVIQNIHHKKTHLVLLDEEKILYGKGFIIDEIEGIQFRISAQSFYQVNPMQMLKLYGTALDTAKLKKTDVVLDAYSGIGTISLLASKRCKEVIAVESNEMAHRDALMNKKMNLISNVRFINHDVTEFIQTFNEKIDCLIMDPTRDGSTEVFMNTIKKLKPKKILYISCEPKTQVRDLNWIKDIYKIESVQAVDMFSQTVHVESIVLLSLRTA